MTARTNDTALLNALAAPALRDRLSAFFSTRLAKETEALIAVTDQSDMKRLQGRAQMVIEIARALDVPIK